MTYADTPAQVLTGARATYFLFRQDKRWWDRHGKPHDITEMSVRYKIAVIAFLERYAPSHATLYGVGQMAAILAGPEVPTVIGVDEDGNDIEGPAVSLAPDPDSWAYDAIDRELQAESRQRLADPLGWLRSTPLLTRLRHDVDNGIGGDDGEREHRAWLATRRACGDFAPGGHTTYSPDCPYCVEANSNAPEWTI